MDVFEKIAIKIIQEQEGVMGSIAVEQAQNISGLTLDWTKHEVVLQGDKCKILDELVDRYKSFFGYTSVEVSREAAKEFLPELPKDKKPKFLS